MSTHYQQHSALPAHAGATEAVRSTLLDNDEVLATVAAYPPGTAGPLHTHHFPSVVCVVEGGTLQTTTPDGTVETYELRPGETLWSGAGSAHRSRNIGTTPVRLVEIEVKHAVPAAHEAPRAPCVLTSDSLEWKPDPAHPGRSAALLVGDPTLPGPYTVRYRAPAGYEIGLHMHPDDDEQLTVISGTMLWSAGAAGSGAQEYELTAGGFVRTPAGTPHRIVAMTDVVLQMSGMGLHEYVYLNAGKDAQ